MRSRLYLPGSAYPTTRSNRRSTQRRAVRGSGECLMARIRTIKPEFWTDERIGECSMPARLLFIATWNIADDHGGLDRSAKQLKAQAFPYDNIDCEPLVQELLSARLLVEYESGGKKYLHIRGFRKHQKNEKPAAPRFPLYQEEPDSSSGSTVASSGPTATGCGSTERSGGSSSSLGKIKEGKGDEREARAREPLRGVVDMGTGLTDIRPLETWRRDVPECNPEAFASWVVHCELSGKMLGEPQRLLQARQLSKNGDFAAQAEVVEYCISQGWKSLVPIADVRARRDGMSRAGPAKRPQRDAPTTAELEALEAARAGH
jgi:hypothetical protein